MTKKPVTTARYIGQELSNAWLTRQALVSWLFLYTFSRNGNDKSAQSSQNQKDKRGPGGCAIRAAGTSNDSMASRGLLVRHRRS